VDDADRRRHQPRDARAARHGDPDVGRELRADSVESKCRQETYDPAGHLRGSNDEVMSLGVGALPCQPVATGHGTRTNE
jgi:hypothetical protein